MKRNNVKLISSLILILIIGNITFFCIKYYSARYSNIIITAHRGDSGKAPENTIPAIQQAIAAGEDCVEIDVRQTKDKVLVLLHDASLMRTTDVPGNVWDYNYEELQKLDAGKWFNEEYMDTKVPTLQQALRFSKGKVKLNIEIKDCADYKEIAEQVMYSIEEYGMEEECVISSTNYACLEEIERLNESILTGIILDDGLENPNEYAAIDFFSINFSKVLQGTIDQIHDLGKEIHVWTIDDKETLLKAEKMKVDNIITNNPLLAEAVINNSNKGTSILRILIDLIYE